MSDPVRPLRPAVGAAIVVAALGATLLPGCSLLAAGSVAVAVLARLVADRRGRPLLPSGVAAALWALLPFGVALAVWIRPPGTGQVAGAFVDALVAVEVLTLLAAPRAGTTALLLSIAGIQATATVLGADAAAGTCAGLAFGVSLLCAFVALERDAAPQAGGSRDGPTRRVRAPSDGARARGTLPAAFRLAAVGLPLGALFFLALPPSPSASAASEQRERRAAARERAAQLAAAAGRADGVEGEPGAQGVETPIDPGTEWRSGARTRMRLGFVERVQNDDTPMLFVRVDERALGAEPLRLRGLCYDVFTGVEWQRSPAAQREDRVLDAAGSAWQTVAREPSGRALVRVSITDLAGQDEGPLFLLPEPERVRLLPSAAGAKPFLTADGTVYASARIPADGAYEEDARDESLSEAQLLAAKSTPESAPLLNHSRPPAEAEVYAALAREAVGEETRPAAQAALIDRWLRRRCAYSLSLPQLDRRRPVLDFLNRARRGPCEYFASAMTLMLRCLGHPARYVVGVRGGEKQGTGGAFLFRGTHAHAWTELWLDGHGWKTFDPTPPDEQAVDYDPEAAAKGTSVADEDDEPSQGHWLDRRLGAIGAGIRRTLSAAWDAVGGAFRIAIPVALVLLAAFLLFVRGRRAPAGTAPETRSSSKIVGAYARALAALRGAGILRRRSTTPTEFALAAGRALPPAAAPLSSLTSTFEAERYGEREATAEDRRRMDEQAERVREAVRERRRRPRGPSRGD